MKTLDEVLGQGPKCLDGRDIVRLMQFVPHTDWPKYGCEVREGTTPGDPLPWTRENILAQLEGDVAFGFEKALNRRGLSAGMMYEVVQMWNNILEEGLETFDFENNYAMYGLPLFKATAVKYGWPNPIGDDTGSEEKYNNE